MNFISISKKNINNTKQNIHKKIKKMNFKHLPNFFLLNNGLKIPSIGLGTSPYILPYDNFTECLIQASKIGYRHFDTADLYKNYS